MLQHRETHRFHPQAQPAMDLLSECQHKEATEGHVSQKGKIIAKILRTEYCYYTLYLTFSFMQK